MSDVQVANHRYLRDLSIKMDYMLMEENGQRIFGPPKNLSPPLLDYRYEVMIRNIPYNCTESSILHLFLNIGSLYKFRYMLDYAGNCRGYAFANFTSISKANEAVSKLNGTVINGRTINVVPCENRSKIVVGNLQVNKIPSFGTYEDAVLKLLIKLFPDINKIEIRRSDNIVSYIVEFLEHKSAGIAKRYLRDIRFNAFGKKPFVCWASCFYQNPKCLAVMDVTNNTFTLFDNLKI